MRDPDGKPFTTAVHSTRLSDTEAYLGVRLLDSRDLAVTVSVTGNRGGTRDERVRLPRQAGWALCRWLVLEYEARVRTMLRNLDTTRAAAEAAEAAADAVAWVCPHCHREAVPVVLGTDGDRELVECPRPSCCHQSERPYSGVMA